MRRQMLVKSFRANAFQQGAVAVVAGAGNHRDACTGEICTGETCTGDRLEMP